MELLALENRAVLAEDDVWLFKVEVGVDRVAAWLVRTWVDVEVVLDPEVVAVRELVWLDVRLDDEVLEMRVDEVEEVAVLGAMFSRTVTM